MYSNLFSLFTFKLGFFIIHTNEKLVFILCVCYFNLKLAGKERKGRYEIINRKKKKLQFSLYYYYYYYYTTTTYTYTFYYIKDLINEKKVL